MWVAKKIPIKVALLFLFVLSIGIALILFSTAMGQGVRQGLSLCGELVIPSLYVFICFCEWLCSWEATEKITVFIKPLFRLIFGKGFQGEIPLLFCLLGGYPMGASSLTAFWEQQKLSSLQTKHLSLWLFCPSPAFVITGVGRVLLGSFQAGIILWCCCVASCLLTGVALCRFLPRERITVSKDSYKKGSNGNYVNAVESATKKMMVICGTVILVSGILTVVNRFSIPLAFQRVFNMFLEVTNGCAYLSAQGGSLAEIGAVLMFGGVSTHLQCRMLLGKNFPSYRIYILIRICQAVVVYGLISLLGVCFPQVLATLSCGAMPMLGTVSVLPSVGLLATCFVFLCSLYQKPMFRRSNCEKSGICS